jgi:hypothetical protein
MFMRQISPAKSFSFATVLCTNGFGSPNREPRLWGDGLIERDARREEHGGMKAAISLLMGAVVYLLPAFCGAEESAVTTSRFRDPKDGQIDLSGFLAHPRAFLPIPLVVTEPAVGYGGGLAGLFVRPRKKAGAEGMARPNMSVIGGIATENGTWVAFAGDSSLWFGDRVQTLAGGGGGEVNLDFYGLGDAAESLDEPVRYTLDFTLALMQGSWKIRPKSPWSLGLRYIYAEVEPKLRDEPQFPGLADSIDMKISAPAGVLEFDSRNNLFTPTRGWYSESMYLVSREDFGATEDFERFQQVIMGWMPLSETITLGLRGDYQWTSDGTPFFLRPYIKLRGVAAMRYQGDDMASIEAEARWQFHGRWSLVGAAGYGSARVDRDLYSTTRDVWSGAVGFRYELARMFGMHAGMDVGFSSGETAIYFQIGSAWFRP